MKRRDLVLPYENHVDRLVELISTTVIVFLTFSLPFLFFFLFPFFLLPLPLNSQSLLVTHPEQIGFIPCLCEGLLLGGPESGFESKMRKRAQRVPISAPGFAVVVVPGRPRIRNRVKGLPELE